MAFTLPAPVTTPTTPTAASGKPSQFWFGPQLQYGRSFLHKLLPLETGPSDTQLFFVLTEQGASCTHAGPGLHLSESVVFHLDFQVSSLVRVFWFVFVFGDCFVLFWEDIWPFAFHLFSYNVGMADRLQDVLVTEERARHELKKTQRLFCLES